MLTVEGVVELYLTERIEDRKSNDGNEKPAYWQNCCHDNAYAESLFRTLKYVRQWLSSGFRALEDTRYWVNQFIRWYNEEHRHSGIRYVTPTGRHRGEDRALLTQRDELYHQAQRAHPERW